MSLLKKFWEVFRPPTPHEEVPEKKDSPFVVVEHPNLWIENNYDELKNAPIVVVKILEYAVKRGALPIIQNEILTAGANSIKRVISEYFFAKIGADRAKWVTYLQKESLIVEIQLRNPSYLNLAKERWAFAKQKIGELGVQLPDDIEVWDDGTVSMRAVIPVANLRLDVDSPIFWDILHKHQGRPIVWNQRVLIPKRPG